MKKDTHDNYDSVEIREITVTGIYNFPIFVNRPKKKKTWVHTETMDLYS